MDSKRDNAAMETGEKEEQMEDHKGNFIVGDAASWGSFVLEGVVFSQGSRKQELLLRMRGKAMVQVV